MSDETEPGDAISTIKARKISNSEASTWLTCQRKYYYEYDLGLTPITLSEALNRGILGHDALAAYYAGNFDQQAAEQVVTQAMNNGSDFSMCLELMELLHLYWNLVDDSDWEVIAVEREVNVPLTTDFEYALRFDLLVRSRSTSKFILVDHKFTYDFWSYSDLRLSGQFPKYVAALKAKGIDVSECVLNQLRYRKIKEPTLESKFKRDILVVSKPKMARALKEQIEVSRQIVEHRSLPIEVKSDALRVLNKQVCKYCNFQDLCISEFDGGDIKYAIEQDYHTENTYGYNKTETTELL